jgi:hypothetical protein
MKHLTYKFRGRLQRKDIFLNPYGLILQNSYHIKFQDSTLIGALRNYHNGKIQNVMFTDFCCSVENVSSIVKATKLREVTVDGNPVSLGGDCVSFLVSYLTHLKLLNCMEVTESVRKAATVWRNSKETATHMSQHGTKEMRIDIWREEFLRSQKQSLLSNTLSSSLKDLCCDMDFEVASERYVQSDSGVSSVISSTCTNP